MSRYSLMRPYASWLDIKVNVELQNLPLRKTIRPRLRVLHPITLILVDRGALDLVDN